jgi:hypothetical protein
LQLWLRVSLLSRVDWVLCWQARRKRNLRLVMQLKPKIGMKQVIPLRRATRIRNQLKKMTRKKMNKVLNLLPLSD